VGFGLLPVGRPVHGGARTLKTEDPRVATEELVCAASELPPGKVKGVGPWAVGNSKGDYFAVTRRCRHLFADLAGGTIDSEGCLVCPWHGSRYDVKTGRMLLARVYRERG
jgi:nitrite reductase/ring-hydroxylating ferredoxin subunit